MSEGAGRRALRLLDGATQACNLAGSLLILVVTLAVGADVLGRGAFGAPIPGVPELVTLSIVAIVFLQGPAALRAGRLPRAEAADVFLKESAPGLARALADLGDLAGAAIMGVVLWASWPIAVRAWERGEFVGAVGDVTAPVWPVKAALLIGVALLLLQFLARIARRRLG